MRKAKFLGVINYVDGPIMNEKLGKYSPGDIVTVFPNTHNTTYPWRDKKQDLGNTAYFREGELEFILDKELDLNDYL